MNNIEWHDGDTQDDIEWLDFRASGDYYETLEVSRHASPEVIKRAYRVLVERYHPDKHPVERRSWAEEMTKRLNEAFSTLSDESKRKLYDERRAGNQV